MFTLGKTLLAGDGLQKNGSAGGQLIQTAANKGNEQAIAFIKANQQPV